MLSQSNIDRLNMHAYYKHEPDVEYRGKTYEDNLYWCMNWVFYPSYTERYGYLMIDTYFGNKSIVLTDENFDEFEFLFDRREYKEMPRELASRYDESDVIVAATDSGGTSNKKYYVRKDAKESLTKVIDSLIEEIEILESKLEFKKSELRRYQNDRKEDNC